MVPRSWSRSGRCSGRSGGIFFTSGFLSAGGGSHCLCVLLCQGREGATVKTAQYLWWAWLKVRWEAAVSLVSADAQADKAALSSSKGNALSFFSFLKTSPQLRGSHLLLHFKKLHKVVGEDALPAADLAHPPAGVRTLL